MTPEIPQFGEKVPQKPPERSRKTREWQKARSVQGGFTEGGFEDYRVRFIRNIPSWSLTIDALGEIFKGSTDEECSEEELEKHVVKSLASQTLFADLTGGSGVVEEILDQGELKVFERKKGTRRKHNFGLVSTDSLDESNRELLSATINEIAQDLVSESPVYVIERRVSTERPDKDERSGILRSAGLVGRYILTKEKDRVVWRSRTEKEGQKRKGIDVTQRDNKNYSWARSAWREAQRDLGKHGLTIINPEDSEILQELRDTTYVSDTIAKLGHGWGQEIVDRDGNRFRIDLRGVITPLPGGAEHKEFGRIEIKKKKR